MYSGVNAEDTAVSLTDGSRMNRLRLRWVLSFCILLASERERQMTVYRSHKCSPII